MDNQMKIANDLIVAAERDLWPLSDGERCDLLMDNTSWDSATIRAIVESIRNLNG